MLLQNVVKKIIPIVYIISEMEMKLLKNIWLFSDILMDIQMPNKTGCSYRGNN
jgi:hypothetical protein